MVGHARGPWVCCSLGGFMHEASLVHDLDSGTVLSLSWHCCSIQLVQSKISVRQHSGERKQIGELCLHKPFLKVEVPVLTRFARCSSPSTHSFQLFARYSSTFTQSFSAYPWYQVCGGCVHGLVLERWPCACIK